MAIATAITPQDELEELLLATPEIQAGLAWGTPRWGHPEGDVGAHVRRLLGMIPGDDPLRAELRLLAIVHDSFKYAVRPGERWSADNDHAVLARRFAERFVTDERLLATLELHDEPYWVWRNAGAPAGGLAPVVERLPDVELFARFVELDASTEGKDLSFLWWFRRQLALAGALPAHAVDLPLEAGDERVVYVKTFGVRAEDQQAVADALRAVVAEHAERLDAEGAVLTSEDGLRVMLSWQWSGDVAGRLLRDGDLVRDAMARYPILTAAEPIDARLYRP